MKRMGISVYITALTVCCLALMGAGVARDDRPTTLTVVADGKNYIYTDSVITPSDFSVIEQLEKRKINAPLAEKMAYVDECLSRGADYKTALGACFPLLVRTVSNISRELYVKPTDATVVYRNGVFSPTREKSGKKLSEDKLYASIYCALRFSGGGSVNAYTEPIAPETTAAQLRANLVERGEYTTDFAGSSPARAHNIRLALHRLDGAAIESGGTLSFNGVVGERTEANGYKSAKIILDGRYTDGVGGGVCQASTAVYNAALVSGLRCFANAHSICPSYCPPGLDAMISSVSDLVIQNATSHAVYLSARVSGSKATVRVFGERNEYSVVPESVTLKLEKSQTVESVDTEHKYFDSTAVSGARLLVSSGKDGVSSETYICLYKNGVLLSRTKIRENTYKCLPQIIAVAP